MNDLYESVTRRIVAALEAGTPPWIQPWGCHPADPSPINLSTGRPYRGVNVLLLNLQAATCGYARNRWMTYRQALAIGAHVRKGAIGTPVVFFKLKEVGAQPEQAEDNPGARRVYPLLRTFVVFNAEQIEGLPAALVPERIEASDWDPLGSAEHLLDTSGADIQYGGSKAFYVPSQDRIQMPPRSAFAAADEGVRNFVCEA